MKLCNILTGNDGKREIEKKQEREGAMKERENKEVERIREKIRKIRSRRENKAEKGQLRSCSQLRRLLKPVMDMPYSHRYSLCAFPEF